MYMYMYMYHNFMLPCVHAWSFDEKQGGKLACCYCRDHFRGSIIAIMHFKRGSARLTEIDARHLITFLSSLLLSSLTNPWITRGQPGGIDWLQQFFTRGGCQHTLMTKHMTTTTYLTLTRYLDWVNIYIGVAIGYEHSPANVNGFGRRRALTARAATKFSYAFRKPSV